MSGWQLTAAGVAAAGSVFATVDAAVAVSDAVEGLARLSLLRELLDNVEDDLVVLARVEGASWAAIGLLLGVSRQAAWEKFSGRLEV